MHSRRLVEAEIRSLMHLESQHNCRSETLIFALGEKQFKAITNAYRKAIKTLEQRKKELPLGRRYSKPFYIRKAYSMPPEFEKVTTPAFMREDLVSWEIPNNKEYPSYYRTLYKKPDVNSAIDPNEADLIYESESENLETIPG